MEAGRRLTGGRGRCVPAQGSKRSDDGTFALWGLGRVGGGDKCIFFVSGGRRGV